MCYLLNSLRLKAGLTTRQAFIDIVASDPSHESYLWRLLYEGCLKSIPMLLLNFFYATEIAVLGLSPLNSLSFLGGIISVPVLLIQAYLAYRNPPVNLRSYKRYPFHRPNGDTLRSHKQYPFGTNNDNTGSSESAAPATESHDSDDESNDAHSDVNIETERSINNSVDESESVPMPCMSVPVSPVEMFEIVDMSNKSDSQLPSHDPVPAPRAPPNVKPGHSGFRWKSKASPPPPPSKPATSHSQMNASSSDHSERLNLVSVDAEQRTTLQNNNIHSEHDVVVHGSVRVSASLTSVQHEHVVLVEHPNFHSAHKSAIPAKHAISLSKRSNKAPPPPPSQSKPDRE
jgi:hypothetical protein